MPAANNPCLVALKRVEVVFFGPVDFFELRRFLDDLSDILPSDVASPPSSSIGRTLPTNSVVQA